MVRTVLVLALLLAGCLPAAEEAPPHSPFPATSSPQGDRVSLSVRQDSAGSYYEEGGRVRARVHDEKERLLAEGVAPFVTSGGGVPVKAVLSAPLGPGDYEVRIWTAPCGESGCQDTSVDELPWTEMPLCVTHVRLAETDVALTVLINLGGSPACEFES